MTNLRIECMETKLHLGIYDYMNGTERNGMGANSHLVHYARQKLQNTKLSVP